MGTKLMSLMSPHLIFRDKIVLSPCPSCLFFKGRSVEVMSLSFKKVGTKWGQNSFVPTEIGTKLGQNGDITYVPQGHKDIIGTWRLCP